MCNIVCWCVFLFPTPTSLQSSQEGHLSVVAERAFSFETERVIHFRKKKRKPRNSLKGIRKKKKKGQHGSSNRRILSVFVFFENRPPTDGIEILLVGTGIGLK